MTRKDLRCIHEPFGDAFYFGPERLSSRYEDDKKAREDSGFADSTYKTVFDAIEKQSKDVRRFYIYPFDDFFPPERFRLTVTCRVLSLGDRVLFGWDIQWLPDEALYFQAKEPSSAFLQRKSAGLRDKSPGFDSEYTSRYHSHKSFSRQVIDEAEWLNSAAEYQTGLHSFGLFV
jgi:hypothetical protein